MSELFLRVRRHPRGDCARARLHKAWFPPLRHQCIDRTACVRADTTLQELQRMPRVRCTRHRGCVGHGRIARHERRPETL